MKELSCEGPQTTCQFMSIDQFKYLVAYRVFYWLGDKDSNLDRRSQSPLPYH